MKKKHRERYEYLQKKKRKARIKAEKAQAKAEKVAQRSRAEAAVHELIGWLLYLAIIIGATYLIITYVGQRTRVSGESMLPTLYNEDHLIVDKLSYHFREPKRYEIVVFPFKYKEDTYYIKRIIGLPGETVQIVDGYVYIDGELLGETYGREVMADSGIAESPITLGEDEYFVLGDNRNRSSDSRDASVGVLNRDDLLGRAWVRIWPLKRIGVISHE